MTAKQKESIPAAQTKLSEDAQQVVDLIAKVKANPADSQHDTPAINIFRPLLPETIVALEGLGYIVNPGKYPTNEKGVRLPDSVPAGGIFHIISWA